MIKYVASNTKNGKRYEIGYMSEPSKTKVMSDNMKNLMILRECAHKKTISSEEVSSEEIKKVEDLIISGDKLDNKIYYSTELIKSNPKLNISTDIFDIVDDYWVELSTKEMGDKILLKIVIEKEETMFSGLELYPIANPDKVCLFLFDKHMLIENNMFPHNIPLEQEIFEQFISARDEEIWVVESRNAITISTPFDEI